VITDIRKAWAAAAEPSDAAWRRLDEVQEPAAGRASYVERDYMNAVRLGPLRHRSTDGRGTLRRV
jgi:hypothetical protein